MPTWTAAGGAASSVRLRAQARARCEPDAARCTARHARRALHTAHRAHAPCAPHTIHCTRRTARRKPLHTALSLQHVPAAGRARSRAQGAACC
eukprot:5766863-Prymnesium_polylepis.1